MDLTWLGMARPQGTGRACLALPWQGTTGRACLAFPCLGKAWDRAPAVLVLAWHGKAPTETTSTVSAPESAPKVKKAKVEIPPNENPSLYEICIRTQQALESHIKLDRMEKLELMTELNLLHNHTRQILLHEKEAKKRSWTLLRQHYSRKQLAAKGIMKEYNYLYLLEVPRIRRQTPVLPQRSDSTDLLFVGHDDEIEDTAGTLIYKPDDHPASSSRGHAATPTSTSTIPR